jgi:D-3-phosphoglycerate dehydrogenase
MTSMNLGRVVVAEPFDECGVERLREAGAQIVFTIGKSEHELQRALRDARGLIVRSETRVDHVLLAHAPHLEVVGRAGVGVDAIDLDAATHAGIVVVNTPSANTLAAIEHTFALLLAAMRKLPQAFACVQAGGWERQPFVGRELFGKRLGIIGLGRIGSGVASRAAAFGMHVVAHDPYVPAARAGALGVELLELDDLLRTCEVLTLHVPLTPQTRGMIDARALALVRDDAVLVNCARGGVVDADALLSMLDAGRLRSVAIDVVAQEPPPPHSPSARLLTHERVVATPHLGGSTHEALERIALQLAADIVSVLGGYPADGAVNAPSLHGADAERAGAFVDLTSRLGSLLPQLFDDAVRSEMTIVLQGELESLDPVPFLSALFTGVLPFVTDRRVSLVNAVSIAAELGVRARVATERAAGPFRSLVVVAAGEHRIAGTVLPHGPRIVEIDGFEVPSSRRTRHGWAHWYGSG